MKRDDDERARIERDARLHLRASLTAALAGRDGGGHLRGASPTPVITRALLEIDLWLRDALVDPAGCLRIVILRRLEGLPDLLEAGLGQPAATVAVWLERLLALPGAMTDLVRETDMTWGQRFAERPRFERDGQQPEPDDEYTIAGVTRLLTDLHRRAAAAS
ncbi:MAG TPA: hypothetical protein PLL30_11805 [Candidatus Krumholzibacteria bacterium]|nr:hypothetical protein [Candidatus Krumholzibacteria bacterium]HPD72451.1 hypothetical protein [Candidatus Krumholzibacteria bacterium]HRY40617.1 hypothetical protein [Candidatus Krumholzibacteria bacterium]